MEIKNYSDIVDFVTHIQYSMPEAPKNISLCVYLNTENFANIRKELSSLMGNGIINNDQLFKYSFITSVNGIDVNVIKK